MKTIKVIDLINRCFESDNTLPEKIKYSNKIYCKKDNGNNIYYESENSYENFMNNINSITVLQKKVEIIEEEKEIEKLDVALLGQCDNWLQKRDVNIKSEFELNPYIIENIRENTLYFQRKINELIDVVNEIRKEK